VPPVEWLRRHVFAAERLYDHDMIVPMPAKNKTVHVGRRDDGRHLPD
jgi:hypothetical protein